MLSVAIQIHRNILSAQCYIRYDDDSNFVNTIQVECFSSELQLLFLMNDKIVKKVKIITPHDFFVPSLLSADSSVKSGSTIICRTKAKQAGQSVAECSFRLQVSGTDKLDHAESGLKIDVKDFFKGQFKMGEHWNLFCASCGVGLPLKPVFIENVQEYGESELSEGWFCHGNGPQPRLRPSSQILYLDDTSFYLYPRPESDSRCKIMFLDKICCSSHDIGCQKDGYINDLSTGCSDVSHLDSPGIKCSSKSGCDIENIGQSNIQDFNSFDISATTFIQGQQHNYLPTAELDCSGVKNEKDFDPQVLDNSIALKSNSFSLKQKESAERRHFCDDYKPAVHKDEYSNGFKVLNPLIECESCGNVLTSEKSPFPFIKFYFDKLMFKKSSNDVCLDYAHKIALLSFWSLVTRSRSSFLPCKLFLQSKVRGEELCLLLWIPSSPLALFRFRDSLECISPEISLKVEPVYKVLYFIGTSCSDNVRSWRHDFNVDFYRVSDTMVKTLAGILDSSSSHLPETSGAGGFSCGFLSAPSQLLL